MGKETITVDIEVKVVLNIDLEDRPENWDLFKEVEHQISFDDAQAWIVLSVKKAQRQTQPQVYEPGQLTVTVEE